MDLIVIYWKLNGKNNVRRSTQARLSVQYAIMKAAILFDSSNLRNIVSSTT